MYLLDLGPDRGVFPGGEGGRRRVARFGLHLSLLDLAPVVLNIICWFTICHQLLPAYTQALQSVGVTRQIEREP